MSGKAQQSVSRTPPAKIRSLLRKEVAFGCPVDGCGSPYLSWHHFDPRWEPFYLHNPEGMVALCLHHHKEADSLTFTLQQLRELKTSPYLKRTDAKPQGRFDWKREHLVVLAGSDLFFNTGHILTAQGKPIIWLSRGEDGTERLNLDLRQANGEPFLTMRENDWVVCGDLDDLECPPSGTSLLLASKSQEVSLELLFRQLTPVQFRGELDRLWGTVDHSVLGAVPDRVRQRSGLESGLLAQILSQASVDNLRLSRVDVAFNAICPDPLTGSVAVCTLRAMLTWPQPVQITNLSTGTEGGGTLAGNFFVGKGVRIDEDDVLAGA